MPAVAPKLINELLRFASGINLLTSCMQLSNLGAISSTLEYELRPPSIICYYNVKIYNSYLFVFRYVINASYKTV